MGFHHMRQLSRRSRMLAIHAGQVIDGYGGAPMHDAVVLVEKERITQVGRAHEVEVPSDAEIIDARSMTAMPGLVDAHVHIHTAGGAISNYALAEAQEFQGTLALRAYSYAKRDLEMGFTALRSVHSPAYIDVALRDAINQGVVEGPHLRVAGQGLSITGGHMDKAYWAPEVSIPGRTGVCDGPWECRKAAREQFKRGVDFVKINACSEGLLFRLDPPWGWEMTYAEMEAICDEAHRADRRVAAHTSGGPGLTDAIRAGVDSVEHAHWLTDEQIEMMVSQGTFYVPTLIVNTRSVELGREAIGVTEEEWAWLLKVNEDKWLALNRAKAAGVKIVVGTDAGFVVCHGENARELEELVKGGFTSMEAIVAGTRLGAECLDLAGEIGTIESGKYADLVIVDGDPLADIAILQDESKIVQVFRRGQAVK
jgi:imidazolonepropionase-like amidohydrolase